MRRQMNWNCNQAMIMTKLIINVGGDSGGGGGGAELVDGGMSPWAGYCQCFSYSPRPWSRPSSLPPPPSHPLTRRRGHCLAHLPRLLLDSIASCESWFRWSANAVRILHTQEGNNWKRKFVGVSNPREGWKINNHHCLPKTPSLAPLVHSTFLPRVSIPESDEKGSQGHDEWVEARSRQLSWPLRSLSWRQPHQGGWWQSLWGSRPWGSTH